MGKFISHINKGNSRFGMIFMIYLYKIYKWAYTFITVYKIRIKINYLSWIEYPHINWFALPTTLFLFNTHTCVYKSYAHIST